MSYDALKTRSSSSVWSARGPDHRDQLSPAVEQAQPVIACACAGFQGCSIRNAAAEARRRGPRRPVTTRRSRWRSASAGATSGRDAERRRRRAPPAPRPAGGRRRAQTAPSASAAARSRGRPRPARARDRAPAPARTSPSSSASSAPTAAGPANDVSSSSWTTTAARRDLDRLAGARVVVERAPRPLQRGVIGRHLRDRAAERLQRAPHGRLVDGARVAARGDGSRRVVGVGLDAEARP